MRVYPFTYFLYTFQLSNYKVLANYFQRSYLTLHVASMVKNLGMCVPHITGARAKARCLLIHAEASLSHGT